MNYRSFGSKLVIIAPLAALTGCGLFSSQSVGISKVENLVTWIERIHVNSELAKERVHIAVRSLHTLVAPDFSGDLVTAYSEFVRTIELSEAQGKELRSSFAAMKAASTPVFAKWEEDLQLFSGEAMRKRSGARLAGTKQRYEAIVAAAEPAVTAYTVFNKTIRDHALFLGHDFNAAAIAEIDSDIQNLTQVSRELTAQLDNCQAAARIYVESAALPLHVETVSQASRNERLRRVQPSNSKNLEAQRLQRMSSNNNKL